MKSQGAAVFVSATTTLSVQTSTFESNSVLSGNVVGGGAIGSEGNVSMGRGVVFQGNAVSGGALEAVGGALAIYDGQHSALIAPVFIGNMVSGAGRPRGGAMYVDNAREVRLKGALFRNNTVRALALTALGGAIHIESGRARLDDSHIVENSARFFFGGEDASGGGISVSIYGDLELFDAELDSNDAGGLGAVESTAAFHSSIAALRQSNRAAHLWCAGKAVLQRCSTSAHALNSAEALPFRAAWSIVGDKAGRISIIDSTLSNPSMEMGFMKLVGDAQAIVRGCIGTRIKFADTNGDVLGIVNSTFEPPLDGNLRTIGPPSCGAKVAGQAPMCDVRAACDVLANGGVECRCEGGGLRSKAGERVDGSMCSQDISIQAAIAQRSTLVVLKKPGKSETITWRVVAAGEISFSGAVHINATLLPSGRVEGRQERAYNGIFGSAFGSTVAWEAPLPGPTEFIPLDAAKQKFTHAVEHAFKLHLNCKSANSTDSGACPADGDVLRTLIRFQSTDVASDSELSTDVTIEARVESFVSCNLSHVQILVDGLPDKALYANKASKLQVKVIALDADGFEVKQSSAFIVLKWEGLNMTIPLQRESLASNVFVAEIPQESRKVSGAYKLDVVLYDAWDSSAEQAVKECTLLGQRLFVQESSEFNTLWVLAISACVFGLFLFLIIIFVKKKSKQIQHILRVARAPLLVESVCLTGHTTTTNLHCNNRAAKMEQRVQIKPYSVW